MKTIVDAYDKKLIQSLPRAVFEGPIHLILTESDCSKAIKYLMKQPLLGFDTETRPSFKKGQEHLVALLQVSTPEVCFLFRLHRLGLPRDIVRLLEDKKINKVALSWKDDLGMLQKRRKFRPGTFIELQELCGEFGIKDQSLQKLYANLLGGKISKSQRLSNWEADKLSEAQKKYAATDAWACIRIYEQLMQLRKEGYQLIKSEKE